MEIKKYDDNLLLPIDKASQLIRIFEDNYPDVHSIEDRENDVNKRNSVEKLNNLLKEGHIIFTIGDVKGKIHGLLEMREVDVGDGVYYQLAWIIVDSLQRGKGLAYNLHDVFLNEVKEKSENINKDFCLLLSVHMDNFAKKIYEKLGYKSYNDDEIRNGKIFMIRDL